MVDERISDCGIDLEGEVSIDLMVLVVDVGGGRMLNELVTPYRTRTMRKKAFHF